MCCTNILNVTLMNQWQIFIVYSCLNFTSCSPWYSVPLLLAHLFHPSSSAQAFCLSTFCFLCAFSFSVSRCLRVSPSADTLDSTLLLLWGDKIGRCLPGSLLSQTVHFSVSHNAVEVTGWVRSSKNSPPLKKQNKTTFPWRFCSDLGQTVCHLFCQASFVEAAA